MENLTSQNSHGNNFCPLQTPFSQTGVQRYNLFPNFQIFTGDFLMKTGAKNGQEAIKPWDSRLYMTVKLLLQRNRSRIKEG